MKTLEDIIKQKREGDIGIVAKAAGCSLRLVKAVIYRERRDHKNIQAIFSRLIDERKKMEGKLASK